MKNTPKVTVLMPVYNGEKYLREAIDSILSQTFTDFEFLIINDGSTDRSVEFIKSYPDPRIRLVHNETNLGLIPSLNKGVDLSQGEYIARMDCDDISLPQRLEKQVNFMDTHREVGVCGTWAKVIDINNNVVRNYKTPAGDMAGKLCWWPSVFVHPTCMMRRELLKMIRYSSDYPHAEDYDLWLRLCNKTGFFNLNQFLLLYRVHAENVTATKRTEQLAGTYKAFIGFIGSNKIGYDEFLSLMTVEANINPLKRAWIYWLASSKTGFRIGHFIKGSIYYLMLWVKKHASPDT